MVVFTAVVVGVAGVVAVDVGVCVSAAVEVEVGVIEIVGARGGAALLCS
jgi:hypothetical protein